METNNICLCSNINLNLPTAKDTNVIESSYFRPHDTIIKNKDSEKKNMRIFNDLSLENYGQGNNNITNVIMKPQLINKISFKQNKNTRK